jgi:endonuclease YncB( thermonuclease family)
MIGLVFACVVLSITDGDTLRCRDGTRVRLAGIDAPELPGHCRQGRECVTGDAAASRRALSQLSAGRSLTCRRVGVSYDRIVAFCRSDGVDLSCAQVSRGFAVPRYANRRQLCR